MLLPCPVRKVVDVHELRTVCGGRQGAQELRAAALFLPGSWVELIGTLRVYVRSSVAIEVLMCSLNSAEEEELVRDEIAANDGPDAMRALMQSGFDEVLAAQIVLVAAQDKARGFEQGLL